MEPHSILSAGQHASTSRAPRRMLCDPGSPAKKSLCGMGKGDPIQEKLRVTSLASDALALIPDRGANETMRQSLKDMGRNIDVIARDPNHPSFLWRWTEPCRSSSHHLLPFHGNQAKPSKIITPSSCPYVAKNAATSQVGVSAEYSCASVDVRLALWSRWNTDSCDGRGLSLCLAVPGGGE